MNESKTKKRGKDRIKQVNIETIGLENKNFVCVTGSKVGVRAEKEKGEGQNGKQRRYGQNSIFFFL